MSKIVFTCECGKVYTFDYRFAGRASRCVLCKRDYIVPSVSEQLVEAVTVDTHAGNFDSAMCVPPPILDSPDDSPEGILEELLIGNSSDPSSINVSASIFSKNVLEPAKPELSERIGKFEIREKIGSGGMGKIFHAWDTHLHRNVTIKTLNERSRQQSNFKERFINEARIAGKLIHSGVIPIYSLDFDEKGDPYYVMRLCDGRTLEELITQYHNLRGPSHTPEELRRLIRQFIAVCQTMAYAHANFVVHRDIKPANIMLGGYGETLVLDWGLAKILSNEKDEESSEDVNENIDGNIETDDGAVDLTISGGRVGTLGYQSPEYLRKGVSQPSDDIYALGVTLYSILCNRLPYKPMRDTRGFFELMMTPPKPPHLDNPHVSRQLSAVCLCAMAFDQANRYDSASKLAADLQRWLDGEVVSVYRMKWNEKLQFLLQKNILSITIGAIAFGIGFFLARLLF